MIGIGIDYVGQQATSIACHPRGPGHDSQIICDFSHAMALAEDFGYTPQPTHLHDGDGTLGYEQ